MASDELNPLSDERLLFLDRLSAPVWITDVDRWCFRWANRAALELWHAESLMELVNRPVFASDTIRTTFYHLRAQALAEGVARIDHTVYPKSVAVRLRTTCSPYPLPEGTTGLLLEAQPAPTAADSEVIRASEAVRYAPLVVTTHALDGTTLAANALARRKFGNRFRLQDIFAEGDDAAQTLAQLAAGEEVSRDALLNTTLGKRWFALEARRVPDPVTAGDAILLSAHDVTARREAELAKDELISIVSHELRTPLTAIRGALSLLVNGRALGMLENEEELFDIAAENAARLGHLLDDLLDVQRIGLGRLEIERVTAPLSGLAERAIGLIGPLARAKEVRVTLSADPAEIFASVDPERIVQVFTNLLSNAIKHSPRGAEVRVELMVDGHVARVNVKDQGPGIPPAFRPRIFGRFEQADASSTRAVGGAGLGLYIAKTLVEHHGGRLAYEEGRSSGAAFFFELPLGAARLK